MAVLISGSGTEVDGTGEIPESVLAEDCADMTFRLEEGLRI